MNLMTPRIEIIAHRGASADAAENTISSLDLAIVQGADWVECDVRRSADGVMFVHHDSNRGMNLLKRMKFEDIKALPGAGDVPTFEQFLRSAHGRVKLDVELKETGYESDIVELIRDYFGYRDILVTSFLDEAIARVKQLDPKIRTGLLVGQSLTDENPLRQLGDFFPQRRVRRSGADVVVCHYLMGDAGTRWWLRQLKIPVILWTVDRPKLISRYLKDPNVIAIITNKPAVAVKLRDEAETARLKAKI